MEQGKIYFVYDPGEIFWMLGRCTNPATTDDERNIANYITSQNEYFVNRVWCYQDKKRKYREDTTEEEQWFVECEKQQKFIPKEKINFSYSIY